MRLLLTAAAFVSVVVSTQPPLLAQRNPGIVIAPVQPQRSMHSPHFFPAPLFLGSPWPVGYEPAVTQPNTPAVIVVQTQPAAPQAKEESKPINPLLIELHNGRYVRSDTVEEPSRQTAATSNFAAARTEPVPSRRVSRELVPAVLVFRDGHREQVREYTIVDGAIYAHGDYWVDGYWNRKILLAALDLPATLSANRENGIDFVLPSGPNVVVIRP